MAKSFFKPLVLAASIISLIQSLLYSILSFLAILLYNDVIKYDDKNVADDYKKYTEYLYRYYFSARNFADDERLLTPDSCYIIMWFYFFLSLFWCFSSGVQLTFLAQKAKPDRMNMSVLVWLSLTFCICLFDFISCILFGVDYEKMKNLKYPASSDGKELARTAPITMMILAAKGFILWAANLIFSILITKLFVDKLRGFDDDFEDDTVPLGVGRQNRIYNAFEGDKETEDKVQPIQSWLEQINGDKFKLVDLLNTDDDSDKGSIANTEFKIPRAMSVISSNKPRTTMTDSVTYDSIDSMPSNLSANFSPVDSSSSNSVSPELGHKLHFGRHAGIQKPPLPPAPPILRSALKRHQIGPD